MQLVHLIVVYRRLIVHTTVSLTVLRSLYNVQGVKKSIHTSHLGQPQGLKPWLCFIYTS